MLPDYEGNKLNLKSKLSLSLKNKKFLGAKILRLMPMILKDRVLEKRYKKIMNIQNLQLLFNQEVLRPLSGIEKYYD